jgi:SAM-dependent methyltransferase
MDPEAERARLQSIYCQYASALTSRTETMANEYAASCSVHEVRGPDVLVLGAATGAWVGPLLAHFPCFETVDAVADAVAHLVGEFSPRITGHVALFEEFAPPHRYDTVVMGHVLEHLADPKAVISRARDWLKPSGRIVALVPNAGSLHRRVGVRMGLLPSETALGPSDERLGHRRVYTWDSLRQDFEAAEFRCAQLSGLMLKPVSNAQMDEWPDALIRAFLEMGGDFPEAACMVLCVAEATRDG